MIVKKDNSPRCSAFCTANRFRMSDLKSDFERRDDEIKYFRLSDALHRSIFNGDVFYFSYGAIVIWGLSEEEEKIILDQLVDFQVSALKNAEIELSKFSIGDTAKILRDDIILPKGDVMTKMAFSHGLAQSVKLSAFEKLIDSRIETCRAAPMSLANKGHIPLSRKKLNKMMGKIVLDRSSINLHTDILDTPEFFWENSDLEPLYRLITQDLDIKARLDVLNRRLDILKDLLEILSNELENRHSSTLEWIIIILISIEVVITFAKDIFHII